MTGILEVSQAERPELELFALVSHELRIPLTSLVGYVEIVRDGVAGAINPEQRRYLDVIERNAKRLLRLADDLLATAQAEAGQLPLQREAVDLDSILRDAVEAARPRAEQRGIALRAETEPLPMAGGDSERLGQLIDNLVSNALKFTPEGGAVTVRGRRVEGNRALVEVADTGIGISPPDRERLVERFYRAGTARGRAIPGAGLGLSICKAIAEGHGGSIEVESEEGLGATFLIELPLGA